jgi:hypothetical protein
MALQQSHFLCRRARTSGIISDELRAAGQRLVMKTFRLSRYYFTSTPLYEAGGAAERAQQA